MTKMTNIYSQTVRTLSPNEGYTEVNCCNLYLKFKYKQHTFSCREDKLNYDHNQKLNIFYKELAQEIVNSTLTTCKI